MWGRVILQLSFPAGDKIQTGFTAFGISVFKELRVFRQAADGKIRRGADFPNPDRGRGAANEIQALLVDFVAPLQGPD